MKNKNLLDALTNAKNGFLFAFKNELNFKIELFVGFLVVSSMFFLDYTNIEIAILLLTISSVLTTELINTAIENIVDMYCDDEYSKLGKVAKDTAAMSVLVSAITSIAIGCFIIIKKIM